MCVFLLSLFGAAPSSPAQHCLNVTHLDIYETTIAMLQKLYHNFSVHIDIQLRTWVFIYLFLNQQFITRDSVVDRGGYYLSYNK